MIFMKIFLKIKICLTLVIIHNIQNFLKLVNKKVYGEMRDDFGMEGRGNIK